MEVLIQTRGLTLDYQFLGSAPGQRWWLEYSCCTNTVHPTAMVCATGDRWQAYLGGVPSGRKDSSPRPIRFDLVLTGDARPADAGKVLPLLRAWLDFAGRGDDRLQKSLQAEFPEDVVEDLLATPGLGDERDQRIAAWARDQFGDAEADRAEASARRSGRWLGSVDDDEARKEFLAHAAGILRGDAPGRALVLNLLETRAAVEEHVQAEDGNHGCVILVTHLAEQLDHPLVRLADPTDESEVSGENEPPQPPWQLVVALVAAGITISAGYVIWNLAREVWRRLHP